MSEIQNKRSGSPGNQPWSTEWLRGFLPLFALHAISAGPTYGYAISSALAYNGIGDVKGGTLYPLLSRQEAAGFVSTEWKPGEGGPGRKYFALTPAGAEELSRLRQDWAAFVTATEEFLNNPRRAK